MQDLGKRGKGKKSDTIQRGRRRRTLHRENAVSENLGLFFLLGAVAVCSCQVKSGWADALV